MRYVFVAVGFVLGAAAYIWTSNAEIPQAGADLGLSSETAIVAIALPSSLSDQAQRGKALFDANCAECHASHAVGQIDVAPPLVHEIYEPSHHGDESFQRAVAQGVRGHHWPFGNMPPIDDLSREDVEFVIEYVRELQRANGIN